MTRKEVLEEASKCILGDREQDYGRPEDNFQTIANLWSIYKGCKYSSLDVAVMMCLLKIARIKNGGGSGDSYVDLCGYAAIAGELYSKKDDACMTGEEIAAHIASNLPSHIAVEETTDILNRKNDTFEIPTLHKEVKI